MTHSFIKARGFTLVEMMVSVAIFAIVMTISLGALLSMSESDRKSQTLKSVINNLNFSMDSMSRSIRTGQSYHCDISQGSISSARDCPTTAATSFAFQAADGATVSYCLYNNSILREITPAGSTPDASCAASGFGPITSSEVHIDSLNFYVTGSAIGDGIQPKVTILISGEVVVTATQKSALNLQTSITQRVYDQ